MITTTKERPSMKPFSSMKSLFSRSGAAATTHRRIYREWDRQRAMALSPSDLAEIDAIFARHL
jgi:hypothetical protein